MKQKFDRKTIEKKQRIQFVISIIASMVLGIAFSLFFFYALNLPVLESVAFAAALAVLITEFMDNKFYKYQKTPDALFNSLFIPLIIMIIYLILYYMGFKF